MVPKSKRGIGVPKEAFKKWLLSLSFISMGHKPGSLHCTYEVVKGGMELWSSGYLTRGPLVTNQ